MKQRYRVRVDYPDGSHTDDGNAEGLEVDYNVIRNCDSLRIFCEDGVRDYPITMGMTIKITEWNDEVRDQFAKEYGLEIEKEQAEEP